MNKIISYFHLVCCIGWTLFILICAIAESQNHFSSLDWRDILLIVLASISTLSGIYMFFIYRNRKFTELENLSAENEILERRIMQNELKKKLSESVK
jgi:hypothetical protein